MKTIIVRTQFEALHQYEGAPKAVEFLSYPHRHLFKVAVEISVSHGDRYLEFFTVKDVLDNRVIGELLGVRSKTIITASCEDIAEFIAGLLPVWLRIPLDSIKCVEVSEDGENAGRYYPE